MKCVRGAVGVLIVLVILESMAFAKDPFVPPWVEQVENKKEKKLEIKKYPVSYPKLEDHQRPKSTVEKEEPPFYEKEEIEVIKPSLDIDGIVYSVRGGVFISGDRIYRVGDEVADGCIVKRINPKKVIVRCGNNLWSYTVEGVEDHEIY